MVDLQRALPKARVFRWDNGTAYAIHSVHKAIALLREGHSLADVMKALIRFTYGNEGFPDLTIGCNGKCLGIEVKVGKDKLRESQQRMKTMFGIMGWHYYEFTDKRDYKTQLNEVVCLMM